MLKAYQRAGLELVKIFLGTVLLFLIFASDGVLFAQQTSPKKKPVKAQVLEAERILSDLGYWVLKVDGVADDSTRHALIAFQKVENRKRTGILNETELKALRAALRPTPKFTGEAHIEVDLTRQVLFLVNENGIVTHILPVSSGNEKKYQQNGKWEIAHTPRGTFKIERQIKGVRQAPLGNLYNPNYFYYGVAIHGSNSIPIYPDSHGCVRIPRFADKAFQEMVWIGMPVYVYD
jgi:lipoprotein-anchoring transpeptidase ErfK/SrfK